ncbi:MAG TPA: hypothetical protein VGM17_05355 [Rhizomicrobium sp.]|jgi:hypothetical protein
MLRYRFLIRLDIPESHNPIANRFQKGGPLLVVVRLGRLGVMFAIQLDDELGTMTDEIRVVLSDLRLSAEMHAFVAKPPKASPNTLLGFGLALA